MRAKRRGRSSAEVSFAGSKGTKRGQILVRRKWSGQVDPRALPAHPSQLPAPDLPGQALAVLRGRDRDHRVRVHVIHVPRGDETVRRGVDAGGPRVQVEGAVREIVGHLVLVLPAPVDRPQGLELVEVEGGEAVHLQASEIAPRPLYP